ncbi:MAG: phytanoyl-CoA dioxygenase family protein [Candidatus Latescibacterota bacterium]
MQVTEQHIEHYRQQGYCLVKGLIPKDLIAAVRARVEEIVADKPDWPERHFQVVDPTRYTSAGGQAIPQGIQRPSQCEKVFTTVAHHDHIAAAMQRLLGSPVECFTDQIGVKLGAIVEEQGGRSYYHQDSFYWHIDPELGCNCWIPLQDVDREAIALAVMPGSQRGWQLIEHESYFDDPPMGHVREDGEYVPFKRHRVPLDQVDFAREVLLPMAAGDGLFFTNYTWHRSEPNRSGENRAFYAIAYHVRGE